MLDTAPGRPPPVAPALDRIPATARREPPRTFPSCAHHLPRDRRRDPLSPMDKTRAPGVDGHRVAEVMAHLDWGAQEGRRQIQTHGYQPPPVRRGWRPQPGKAAQRPLGMPTVVDRALQPRTAPVLEAIAEPDVLNGSLGGSPGRRAPHALATRNAIMAGKQVRGVREADLRHCFGRLDQTWALRCMQRRVGDPRRLTRMRRGRKAGVLRPEGAREAVESGTPQGGRIRNSDGRAGHIQRLLRISRRTEQLWRKPVSRRSQDGAGRWEKFPKLKQRFPLVQPKLSITSAGFQASAKV